jgi:predicted PurR-regulated permease PerM
VIQNARRVPARVRRSRRIVVRHDSELPYLPDHPVAPKTIERRRTALGVLLAVSFVAVARLAEPVWVGIVFGALMAFTTQPIYRKLCTRFGHRRRSAALAVTLVTGGLCVLGGASALYVLTRELYGVIGAVQQKLETGSLRGVVGEHGIQWAERFGMNEIDLSHRVQSELSRATTYLAAAAGFLVETTKTAVLGLVIGCITMYCVLVEWPSIPVRLERVLPLDPRHTRALVLEFRDVGRSALIGTMATALMQGAVATIGYALAGLSHPVLWGLLTAVASFIPVVGTAVIWAPVSLHYLAAGDFALAALETSWGLLLVVGVGEYVIRPWLVGRRGKGPPLLMLVAAIGGIQVFGLAGIVVGPVLMSLFLAILRIYERENSDGTDAAQALRADTQPLFPLRSSTPTEDADDDASDDGSNR